MRDMQVRLLDEIAALRARLARLETLESTSVSTLDDRYVNVTGDTMSGALRINSTMALGYGNVLAPANRYGIYMFHAPPLTSGQSGQAIGGFIQASPGAANNAIYALNFSAADAG